VAVHLSCAPVRIERVLVVLNNSIYSDNALSYSLALAAYLNARLYLLRFLPPVDNAALGSNGEKSAPEYCDATEYFTKLEASQKLASVEHLTLIKPGTVPQVVSEAINESSIDVIVTGSDEKGYMGGSTGCRAEDLLEAVSCPVITVRPGTSSMSITPSFQHILCATDFSVGSVRALFYGLLLANKSHGSIGLLHVMKCKGTPPGDGENGSQQRAVEKLYGLIPEESDSYVTPHTILRFGAPPAREIISIADEEHADLITMGIHKTRRSTISKYLPQGVAYYVLRHARCPVLTVCGRAGLRSQTEVGSYISKGRLPYAE